MQRKTIYLLSFILFFRLSGQFLFSKTSQINPGDQVVVSGCLESQPKIDRGRQSFYLSEIKIVAKPTPSFDFGDCLKVEGAVSSYDYQQKEYLYIDNPKIEKTKRKPVSGLLFSLQKAGIDIQARAVSVFTRWLPEPQGGIILGIVLGAKSKLPKDFYEKLRTTGTLHIIVASGYNLTVISQRPVEAMAWITGRKLALGFGWIMVWGYALISGGEPPVVRAAIIISIIYLAQFIGRKFAIWRAFMFSVWLMLVVSPSLLVSISFQLSIAAMFGLLTFKDKWQGLRKIPFVGRDLSDSLGAQLMVLPIIGYHFGQVSWGAPLINMIVLPLVPRMMMFGIISLVGLAWLPLAIPFLYLAYPLCWFFVWFINLTGKLSWLNLPIAFPWWMVLVYYLVLFYILSRKRSDEETD